MKNISKYINKLLYLNDCVIIPGLGGFVTNYMPAEINEEQNFFYPPTKQILFNKKLNTNDGLLINAVAKSENTDYNAAKKYVSEFVQDIFTKLENDNLYIFKDLGTLTFDTHKNLIFEPDTNSNLLADAYGLCTFHFPKIETKEPVKQLKEKFKDKEAVKQVLKQPITKRIVIGIPLVLALLILPFKTNIFEYSNVNKTNISSGLISSNNNLDNEINNLTKKENALLYVEPSEFENNTQNNVNGNNNTTIDSSESIKTIENKKAVETKSNDSYFIIAGSFAEQERAEIFCKNMTQKDYEPVILERKNGRLRVSIKSFSKKTEAVNALNNYRNNSDLPLWLLTQ